MLNCTSCHHFISILSAIAFEVKILQFYGYLQIFALGRSGIDHTVGLVSPRQNAAISREVSVLIVISDGSHIVFVLVQPTPETRVEHFRIKDHT